MARLKGDDIHSVPIKLDIKALFLRMAVIWEATRAQSKHDQSEVQRSDFSILYNANQTITTDKIDLKYVSFENMAEYLIKILNDPDCGPNHLSGTTLRAGCWLLLAFHFFMRWLLMAIFR
eukprot:SAG25_NODE_556_length_6947_cov_7.702242_2_plen_120_part_00